MAAAAGHGLDDGCPATILERRTGCTDSEPADGIGSTPGTAAKDAGGGVKDEPKSPDSLHPSSFMLHPSLWEADLEAVQKETTEALARRLLARATGSGPGYLLLNPCSFARRFPLELNGISGPLPLGGPLKACQVEGARAGSWPKYRWRFCFAWIPCTAPGYTPPKPMRMKLADQRRVRNEFLEAEVDPYTGGLKAIRDHRVRGNRLGQQLVFNPGSTMRAKEVRVTSAGPALGEIISEGVLFDEDEKVLATFRQRFRAWLGRPVLDLRVEIHPQHRPVGYPWHAYYGSLRLCATNGQRCCAASTAQAPSPVPRRRKRPTTWKSVSATKAQSFFQEGCRSISVMAAACSMSFWFPKAKQPRRSI